MRKQQNQGLPASEVPKSNEAVLGSLPTVISIPVFSSFIQRYRSVSNTRNLFENRCTQQEILITTCSEFVLQIQSLQEV
ncbi:hypothetical protein EYC80_004040 [Monilinia laxa]|uniref:Uncharacterized protein n=1 Tax=Monilinia laxa TaxID=61186 RepID=A0A5N6KLI5_MONLA|nr:hypothetical protein EYC80_004040 [Monilinia laxa]